VWRAVEMAGAARDDDESWIAPRLAGDLGA